MITYSGHMKYGTHCDSSVHNSRKQEYSADIPTKSKIPEHRSRVVDVPTKLMIMKQKITFVFLTLLTEIWTFYLPKNSQCHSATRPRELSLQEKEGLESGSESISGSPIFKRWHKPVVESNGDYAEDKFLDDYIGGALYSSQNSLPRLPVPSIKRTLKSYLPTALPLAESKQEEEDLIIACKLFTKEASALQEKLEAKAAAMEESSWLQYWWNSSYLKQREPIIINQSFFCPLRDDGSLPNVDSTTRTKVAMRGACILTTIAQYRSKLCSGQLPLDVSGTKRKPLCSTGFKYQLHSCRIPMKYKDKFRLYDPSLHKHCIVACRGHYFSMDIVDENNNPLPLHELEMGLEHCIELAKAKPALQFGFLTTTDRNSWANNREMLVLVGGERMIKALEKIESSAALICLDDSGPTSLQECAPIYWHGGHDPNMMNRWFDKPCQIICQNNGKAAYLAEHSMLDGMQVDKFCDQINKSKYSVLSTSIDPSNSKCTTKQMPFISNIFEDVVGSAIAYEKINHAIEKAKEEVCHLIRNQEMSIFLFQGYGIQFLKSNSLNHDAFIQMVLQLATYRLFGKQVATYEATMVRSFLHGRTETTRTVSPESHEFVKRMGICQESNPQPSSLHDKSSLLRRAIWTHCKFLSSANKGFGCDRHFFGLAMLAEEQGLQKPQLFSNPLFQRSQKWRVSSSTLPHTPPGFGCVVDDGVGIGYHADHSSIEFIISSRSNGLNWTHVLSDLIEEVLLELKVVVDKGASIQQDNSTAVKL